MLQVLCKQSTGKPCDGSCDEPTCMAKHPPKVYWACNECAKLRTESDAAQRELSAYKQAIAEWWDKPPPPPDVDPTGAINAGEEGAVSWIVSRVRRILAANA